MRKKITGKVVYVKLEAGFWGIIDKEGNQWLPMEMPDQLKIEGKEVTLTIEEEEDSISFNMWGTPVNIITFHT